MRNYRQGIYEVKNKDKYIGSKNPRYLSSYEYYCFRYFDHHKDVIKWGAEIVVVPYMNPSKRTQDGQPKKCRYIVDVYVKYITRTGETKEVLFEIKPYDQTLPPKKTANMKESTYNYQLLTYNQNLAKWQAAKQYAESKGMEFKLLTEKQLYKA